MGDTTAIGAPAPGLGPADGGRNVRPVPVAVVGVLDLTIVPGVEV